MHDKGFGLANFMKAGPEAHIQRQEALHDCQPILQATYAVGIDSLESIPGFLKRLQIRALL
jgi:hypothetical protein